jgi:radical SAM superfamily enzyme YgiQ (UPF0313 family)
MGSANDLAKKKNIYVAQFSTGTNINLLPLAAGQLVSRLKQEKALFEKCALKEIVFRRPDNPREYVNTLQDVFVMGFSCFLWNMNISLQVAQEVKSAFPRALVVVGGPSIPKSPDLTESFFRENPSVDVICVSEGEEIFVTLCHHHLSGLEFGTIPGIIYKKAGDGSVIHTEWRETVDLEQLPSPYLDGTFDSLYEDYKSEFSGVIWETNRGCPFQCAFCTWGNLPSHRIREKPMEQVLAEIEWISKKQIAYIAMTDSNFGIKSRDIEIARALVEARGKHGSPSFISVSWAKHSPENVLEISKILREGKIGFRITQALQSYNVESLKAVERANIQEQVFKELKERYYKEHYYTYTELILGLPLETLESYLDGIETGLTDSVFEQLYVYPLLLFPNTKIATEQSRKKFGIVSRIVPMRYTKSKTVRSNYLEEEKVEIVVGTDAMPMPDWIDSFVLGYYTLALHDNRLAFFVLQYLRREYQIKIVDFSRFLKENCGKLKLEVIVQSFKRLEDCARGVQKSSQSHIIEPNSYGGIPYDPPEAIFLELILVRNAFYDNLFIAVKSYLQSKGIPCEEKVLEDLINFQKAVMAHPHGIGKEKLLLKYDWMQHLSYMFHLERRPLLTLDRDLWVIDNNPGEGDPLKFLDKHFNIRGIPAFTSIVDETGSVVFPPVPLEQ